MCRVRVSGRDFQSIEQHVDGYYASGFENYECSAAQLPQQTLSVCKVPRWINTHGRNGLIRIERLALCELAAVTVDMDISFALRVVGPIDAYPQILTVLEAQQFAHSGQTRRTGCEEGDELPTHESSRGDGLDRRLHTHTHTSAALAVSLKHAHTGIHAHGAHACTRASLGIRHSSLERNAMGNTSSRRGSSTRELEKYTKPTGCVRARVHRSLASMHLHLHAYAFVVTATSHEPSSCVCVW